MQKKFDDHRFSKNNSDEDLKNLMRQRLECEIKRLVPKISDELLKTLSEELKKKKQWDLALESISEDISIRELQLLKESANSDPIKSILAQLDPPEESDFFLTPNHQEERLNKIEKSLYQIRKQITERVAGLDEESLEKFMSTLEEKKDWDQAFSSIDQDVSKRRLELLTALSNETDFKNLLNNLKPGPQEEISDKTKASLTQIRKLITERVAGLDEESLKKFMSTLEEKKDWDQAFSSIDQDVPKRRLDLLAGLSKEEPVLSFLENVSKVQCRIEKQAEILQKSDLIEEAKINVVPIDEHSSSSQNPNKEAEIPIFAARKKRIFVEELNENYKEMPSCFEKSVILLISYTAALISDLSFQPKGIYDVHQAIDDEFELLKKNAKNEDRESEDVIRVLKKIETFKIQKDWRAVSK